MKVDATGITITSIIALEDGCYMANDPRYPGCMAHGATMEEAEGNLTEARELYLEDGYIEKNRQTIAVLESMILFRGKI